jgi:hypothetical protein
LEAVKQALVAQEALVELIATHAGTIIDLAGKIQKVNRAAPNEPSVIYDTPWLYRVEHPRPSWQNRAW